MSQVVRTRVAPSPTGIAHVGSLYISLFNYAFAKQHGGQFLVRSEDTDRTRFVEGAEQVVLDALKWAGIVPDESVEVGGPHAPYRQSERLELYKKYVDELLAKGHAYYCFATPEELAAMREEQQKQGLPPKYDGRYREYPVDKALERVAAGESHVIRMRVPEGKCRWNDLIRDDVEIDYAQIDDQVLLKSDGYPTYHLAVVVDDHLMEITHVLRGEEWISSTPKHILLYEMFGWQAPAFGHMPLLRNSDHTKLSKRRNDVSVVSYQEKGFLPEALLNFLMLLGWSHPEGREFLSLDEFIRDFDLSRMQKTGPVFDIDKLSWMNGKYIREVLPRETVIERLQPFLPSTFPHDKMEQIFPLVFERLTRFDEFNELTNFFYEPIEVDQHALLKKGDHETVALQLKETRSILENIPGWTTPAIEAALRGLQEKHDWKKSQYFMMVRIAVTGRSATPPLFETMEVIGKDECLARLGSALRPTT